MKKVLERNVGKRFFQKKKNVGKSYIMIYLMSCFKKKRYIWLNCKKKIIITRPPYLAIFCFLYCLPYMFLMMLSASVFMRRTNSQILFNRGRHNLSYDTTLSSSYLFIFSSSSMHIITWHGGILVFNYIKFLITNMSFIFHFFSFFLKHIEILDTDMSLNRFLHEININILDFVSSVSIYG